MFELVLNCVKVESRGIVVKNAAKIDRRKAHFE